MENISKFLFLIFVSAFLLTACGEKAGTSRAEETEVKASQPSQEATAELQDIIDNRASTFMAGYEITGITNVSEKTLYRKGENLRYDLAVGGETGSIYFMDQIVYSCSPGQCVDLGNATPPRTMSDQFNANLEGQIVSARPSRVIAGVTAKCFGFSDPSSLTDVETCYSPENVMLYARTSVAGEATEIKAVEYSTTVSDSVFELPSEPEDLSALVEQYQ